MPVDTFTLGAELRLNWNENGYNLTARAATTDRQNWEPWGDPATSRRTTPDQKDYWKYSSRGDEGVLLRGLPQAPRQGLEYLDGNDLDRFSQWDFGPFSTHSDDRLPERQRRARTRRGSTTSPTD